MRRLILLLLLLPLGGCSAVRVPQPVGDTPVTLDAAEWNGTWCAPDLQPIPGTYMLSLGDTADCVAVTVVDEAGGVIEYANTRDPNDRGRLHLLTIGHDESSMYGSDESTNGYQFAIRLHKEHRALVLWAVSDRGFRDEVADGRLPGQLESGDVSLNSIDRNALDRIAADEGAVLFDWREPAFLIRVTEDQ
jgi:hypothetical protein